MGPSVTFMYLPALKIKLKCFAFEELHLLNQGYILVVWIKADQSDGEE